MGVIEHDFINPETPSSSPAQIFPLFDPTKKLDIFEPEMILGSRDYSNHVLSPPYLPYGSENRMVCPEVDFSTLRQKFVPNP